MIKKILILCVILLNSYLNVNAQAPQKFSYQSVIRNSSGLLITNSNISLRISIMHNSSTGAIVYSETHSVLTNTNGLATLEIGSGDIVTGTFNNINWSSGNYFIKTEADITGGNNYTITGTSQLLSVPYALYAENSKHQGKTSIFITGDITDVQANLQIKNELGPNTESINIINTSVLTSLNLNSINKLVNLEVSNNSSLSDISFSSLSTVYKKMNITQNPKLTTINFTSLNSSYDDIIISYNPSLSSITFPNLNKIYGTYLDINNNIGLTTISAPSLISANYIHLIDNSNLSSISLNSITTCNNITLKQSKLTTFSIPTLSIGGLAISSNSLLTSVSFPNLVSGQIVINTNSLLTTVSFPNFTTSDGSGIDIQKNSSLNSINIASFLNFTGFGNFYFNNNALPSNQVNSLLNKMLTVTGSSRKRIDLKSQTPPSPPTGQGIIDKSLLISLGNIVTTD